MRLSKFKLGKAQEKVAVEISSHFLKMVFFKQGEIAWWQQRPLETASDREISDMIKQIFNENKAKPTGGILVLSRELLKVGTLHLPSVDEKEIASMVNINAMRQVPYPKDEIILGWRITSMESGYSDVILAICQRNLIRRYIVILETAGLNIEDIRMVSEGSLGWLLEKEKSIPPSQVGFILDIHKHYSDLIAFMGDNLLDSCLISQGADFLERGKENIEHFLNEFKQATSMLPESLLEKRSDSLFIMGAKQKFSQLEESLKKEFNLKVFREEPKQEFPPNVSFVGLLGFKHKGLTKALAFDVPDIKMKQQWRKKIRQLILLGGLLAYIMIVILIIMGIRIYRSQDELMRIQLDYSRYAKEAEELSTLIQRIKIIHNIKSPQESVANYLYQVSQALPAGCHIVSFDFQRQSKLVLRGETEAVSLVFDFVSALDESGVFSDVKTTYTRKIKGRGAAQGSEFEIICFLK